MFVENSNRKVRWLLYGLLTVGLYFSLDRWPLITGSAFMVFFSASTLRLVFKSAGEVKRAHARLLRSDERVNEQISSIFPDLKISNSKP